MIQASAYLVERTPVNFLKKCFTKIDFLDIFMQLNSKAANVLLFA